MPLCPAKKSFLKKRTLPGKGDFCSEIGKIPISEQQISETDGRIRTQKGMARFGRTDGFGHRRVCPDLDGRTDSDTDGYGRIRTDGRTDSDTEGYGRIRTDGRNNRAYWIHKGITGAIGNSNTLYYGFDFLLIPICLCPLKRTNDAKLFARTIRSTSPADHT